MCSSCHDSYTNWQHIIAALIFVAIGYLLLAAVKNVGGRYVGVCMIACTNAAVIPFIAYRTATVTGATSTAIATGGMWVAAWQVVLSD